MNQEEKAFIIRAYDKSGTGTSIQPGATAFTHPVSLDAEKHAAAEEQTSGLQQIPPQLSEPG